MLEAVAKTLIGLLIGGAAYLWGAVALAVLIWTISIIIGLVTLSSQKARSGTARFFATLGLWLGWLLGILLLTPVFLIGFTAARIIGRLAGLDPLQLRGADAQTFWLPADDDRRTVRHIRSLFATEVRTHSGRLGVVIGGSVLGLLLAAEIVARTLGFGNPILYQSNELVDVYPAPNQESHRYGGLIKLNSHSMRGPEYKLTKDPGTLRVLMIGDSTLWGGSYVDQPQIYARLLDDLLDRKQGVNDVEVWNIGVNGWGPFQKVGWVDKFGTYDADVAVVCLPYGDIYRGPSRLANTPWFTPDAPPSFALQEIGRHLLWRSRQMMKGPPTAEAKKEFGQRGIEKYVELATKLQAKGCEVIFAVLPNQPAGMTGEVPDEERLAVEQLRSALKPLGVYVDFPAGLFSDQGSRDEKYFDAVHLNTGGNRVYASHLKSVVEDRSEKYKSHRQASSAKPESAGEVAK